MFSKILLLLSFVLLPLSSGYESPFIPDPPTEMEQAISTVTESAELVLEFKSQTNAGEWTEAGLNGDYVAKAEVKTDEYSQVSIFMTFTSEGSDLFEKITGGAAIIAGNFTKKEAEALVEALNRTIKSKNKTLFS